MTTLEMYNNLKYLQGQLGSEQDQDLMQQVLKKMILDQQTLAVVPDVAAQAFLTSIGRQWIINSGGADVVVMYRGLNHTFPVGDIFCVDSEEAQFFRERSSGSLVASNQADWVTAGGVVKVFYW